jgi:hypothetical protein
MPLNHFWTPYLPDFIVIFFLKVYNDTCDDEWQMTLILVTSVTYVINVTLMTCVTLWHNVRLENPKNLKMLKKKAKKCKLINEMDVTHCDTMWHFDMSVKPKVFQSYIDLGGCRGVNTPPQAVEPPSPLKISPKVGFFTTYEKIPGQTLFLTSQGFTNQCPSQSTAARTDQWMSRCIQWKQRSNDSLFTKRETNFVCSMQMDDEQQ